MSLSEQFSRTEMLIGEAALKRLSAARVAVFGLGGVGGYVCEALARTGVGKFDLFDGDKVDITNINRQIIAAHDTVGAYKADVMKQRLLSINPAAEVTARVVFFLPENSREYDFSGYDYIIDAVDTVAAKIELAVRAMEENIPVISSMGAGNKLDPTAFETADIFSTSVCPLARVMRHELRKRGVSALKVVYSKEPPIKPPLQSGNIIPVGERFPGSIAFVPAVAGLIIAGEVIKQLTINSEQ